MGKKTFDLGGGPPVDGVSISPTQLAKLSAALSHTGTSMGDAINAMQQFSKAIDSYPKEGHGSTVSVKVPSSYQQQQTIQLLETENTTPAQRLAYKLHAALSISVREAEHLIKCLKMRLIPPPGTFFNYLNDQSRIQINCMSEDRNFWRTVTIDDQELANIDGHAAKIARDEETLVRPTTRKVTLPDE